MASNKTISISVCLKGKLLSDCLIFVSAKKDKKKSKNEDDLVKLKEGYEEALGISTPSKEVFCIENKSLVSRLASNKVLTVVGFLYARYLCMMGQNFLKQTSVSGDLQR